MSEVLPRGIVVAHGAMAGGLVDAAMAISGAEPGVLQAVSNRGLSPTALAEQIRSASLEGPTIVFADLPSGSCGHAARRLAHEAAVQAVVCGVNLAMLLDFLTHRDMALPQLLPRLVERGRAAIDGFAAEHPHHGDPAVSR